MVSMAIWIVSLCINLIFWGLVAAAAIAAFYAACYIAYVAVTGVITAMFYPFGLLLDLCMGRPYTGLVPEKKESE